MAGKLPDRIEDALARGVLKRLPLTFLPFVNQQIRHWDYLFPNERRSVERLIVYVTQLTDEQSAALFREVVQLEEKMGVRDWQFSTAEQTIQNSSQLARSPYFQQWRRAVQAVFDAADRGAGEDHDGIAKAGKNLILLGLPRSLPINANTAWRRWKGVGRTAKLDLGSGSPAQSALSRLVAGTVTESGTPSIGLLQRVKSRVSGVPSDAWIVDAGHGLVESASNSGAKSILLSYTRLEPYRQNFSHEMNTMRKDLADADAVFDRLRSVDVSAWCPPEVAADPAVREFVRTLYLSGNGAVIFANSFVQWAASEALRRARPSFLAAEFGLRAKPKPFTGVAVFDNPDQVNPLPAVDDPEGSAVDAQMLALYIWLAAARYDEYQRSTVCVCLAESLSEAYIVAPAEFVLDAQKERIRLDELSGALSSWIA